MSNSGSARGSRGENRFYNPPHLRKQQQQQQAEARQRKASISSPADQKRSDHSECAAAPSSSSSDSGRIGIRTDTSFTNFTNLDSFLEHTTPVVPAQHLPKTSIRGWRNRDPDSRPYFVLGDLWDSFKEWSVYGAGVPLLLNGRDSVVQYYVPYLSGIQLYIDPSRSSPRLRRPGEESDTGETSSDDSCDSGGRRRVSNVMQGAWRHQHIADSNVQRLNRLSLNNGNSVGSSSDESESETNPGQLIFQYLEHELPFSREPFADKISFLASRFPELCTYKSCDLSSASWMSVAWYPIYRIPMGPTLQNLDACFLTYHSLSTPLPTTGANGPPRRFSVRESPVVNISSKLPLHTFGLAFYKFKASFWHPEGIDECQKATSLLQAAGNWLRLLHVNHPDFSFFISHNSYR